MLDIEEDERVPREMSKDQRRRELDVFGRPKLLE